jgi:hypothetical protein
MKNTWGAYDNMYGSFVPAPYIDSKGVSHAQTANGLTSCPQPPSSPGIPSTSGACAEAPDKVGHDLGHGRTAALADWNQGAMNGKGSLGEPATCLASSQK